jgi:hypothetical protein
MKHHVRIRCPICGMLSWQSRLDKEFKFEVLVQEIGSRGRGRITNRYYPPEKEEGVWLLKLALIDKLESVLEELKDEIREEKSEAFRELLDEGQYSEAVSTLSIHHANFDEFATSVKGGILSGPVVEVYAMPARVAEGAPAEEVATPGQLGLFKTGTFPVEAQEEEDIAEPTTPSTPVYRKFGPQRLSLRSQVLGGGMANVSSRTRLLGGGMARLSSRSEEDGGNEEQDENVRSVSKLEPE